MSGKPLAQVSSLDGLLRQGSRSGCYCLPEMGLMLKGIAGGNIGDMRLTAVIGKRAAGLKNRATLALVAASLALLAGCVPNDGPLTTRVVNSGADKTTVIAQSSVIFDVVTVDQRIANSVTTLGQPSLVSTFGFGGGPGTPVIGVGDELSVIIFEAGPDGLFSTVERKSTNIPVVVQPNGHGQIPYAGSILFAGKTLEAARQDIARALKSKAVEPDVVVNISKNYSRTASVQGAVNNPQMVTLGLSPESLTNVIARAGGPAKASYDTYVTMTRGRKSSTVLLQSVIDRPKEDINIQPDDKIFLTYDPQTFTALGSVINNGKVPFDSSNLTLVEATALSGGARADLADPKGYFIFRYEYEAVYRQVVGEARFRDLLQQGMVADRDGRYPIVYKVDMSDPQSYLVTQTFPVRNKDVLYLSRHPATDFIKFVNIIRGPVALAKDVQVLTNN
jgi:polysaccharide export outer membrane protein